MGSHQEGLTQAWLKAVLVENESEFVEVCHYVVLNPVRTHEMESGVKVRRVGGANAEPTTMA